MAYFTLEQLEQDDASTPVASASQKPPKEVCCQGFQMCGAPMYKPIAQAHARARTRPTMCDGCKRLEQCQPPHAKH